MSDALEDHDASPQPPSPARGSNWRRQDAISEILQHSYTTALEHDLLIAEYVEIERNSKGGQPDQPPAGGHQKNDKGIAKAARELAMLGKTEEGRRKLIERALKVANICPNARTAAIAAGLDNNRSALRAIAKALTPELQLEKVQEITVRKQQPRRRRTSEEAAAATKALVELSDAGPEIAGVESAPPTVPSQLGDDRLDLPACLDRRPGHEDYHALVAAWRGAPPPARERFIAFLRGEGALRGTPLAPTNGLVSDRDDSAPSFANLGGMT
jgi:hypothetical protein